MDANEKIEGFAGLLWAVINKGGFRALFFLISLLFIFFYVEKHSRLIYYHSLERRIYLAKQIGEISKKNKAIEADLNSIQSELITELINRKVEPMEFPQITSLVLFKFLSGASFGLLFILIGFIHRRPKAIQGAFLIALFFGLIAIFIPIIGSIWINVLLLMIGQLFLLLVTPRKDPPATPHSA